MFKPLLHKARATAQIGDDSVPPQKIPPSQGPEQDLFSAPVVKQDFIPVPNLFLNVVQNQWPHPGVLPTPSYNDKRFYNMGPSLSQALQLPSVDEPVAALSLASPYLTGDIAEV